MEVDEEGVSPLGLSPLGEEVQLHPLPSRELPDERTRGIECPVALAESPLIGSPPERPQVLPLSLVVRARHVVLIASPRGILRTRYVYLLT